ncbi:MAG: hypothetical protein JNJ50_18955 [Acidobacteria bacterium]|nr:hypothetical protein [Acidobacteriota bacterium]
MLQNSVENIRDVSANNTRRFWEFSAYQKDHLRTLITLTSIFLWMTTFLVGVSVSANKYMGLLSQATGLRSFWGATVMLILSWTWTNVVLLTIFAGVTGEILQWGEKHKKDVPTHPACPSYRSAAIRGFLITLLLLSGNLVLLGGTGPDPTQSPNLWPVNQAYYIRIAATASLLSFLVNHNPRMISALIRRIEDLAEEHNHGKGK